MSRTHRNSKGPGYDFQSRRCFGFHCSDYGPIPKENTKKRERTRRKKILQDALKNPEEFEGRFPGE